MGSSRKKLDGKQQIGIRASEDRPQLKDSQYLVCPIDVIEADPGQPRRFFDPQGLAELAQSIKERGVLQPILVRKAKGREAFIVVAGERRFRAAKDAGLKKLPIVITTGHPAEISIIENVQRQDLTPLEEAEGYGRMIAKLGYTHEDLARIIGKPRTTVTESLTLNKLPEQIKEKCRHSNTYPRAVLREITKQKDEEAMLALFERVVAGELATTKDIRDVTRKPGARTVRTPTAIFTERCTQLRNLISRLDFKKIPREDAQQLTTVLKELDKIRHQLRQVIKKTL